MDSFCYTVSDGVYFDEASVSFDLSAATLNFPTVASQLSRDGDSVSLAVTGSSSGGSALNFSAAGLPDGLGINSATGLISGDIPPGGITYGEPKFVTLTVSDGTYSATQEFTWTVDTRVTVNAVAAQQNIEGQSVSLQLAASIPGGTALTYEVTGLPDGLGLDPATGLISGTIAPGAGRGSPLVTTVTASDGTYHGTQTFQWTVSSPITVAAIVDRQAAEGNSISLQLTASAPGGAALIYSATGLPAGLSLNPATGLISGTIAPGAASESPHLVTVTATDGTYSASRDFIWTVASPVSVAAIADQESVEGGTVSVQVTASGPGGGSLTYSATGLPTGVSINPMTGLISGTIAPGAAGFLITITATDGTYSSSTTFGWTVNPAIVVSSIADRQSVQGDEVFVQVTALKHFEIEVSPEGPEDGVPEGGTAGGDTVGGGAAFTYSAMGLPAGLSIDPVTGTITGTVMSSSGWVSTFEVSVLVTDGTYSAGKTFVWTVYPAVTVVTIADKAASEGDSVSIQVTASVPGGAGLTYSATGLPAGLTISPTTGLITGTISPGAASDTAYLVKVTATAGPYSGSGDFLIGVSSRLKLNPIANQRNYVGNPVALQATAHNPDGRPLTFSALGLPAGLSINPGTGLIGGTLAPNSATNGTPRLVRVAVTDGIYSDYKTFYWTIDQYFIYVELRVGSDSYTTEQGQTLTVNGDQGGPPTLLANDYSNYGDPLRVSQVNGSASAVGATITLSSGATLKVDAQGRFTYKPTSTFLGIDSFLYTVTNGIASATATVYITVQATEAVHLDEVVLKYWDALGGGATQLSLAAVNEKIERFDRADGWQQRAAALATLKLFVLANGTNATNLGPYATTFGVVAKSYLTKDNAKNFATNRQISATDPNLDRRKLGELARDLDAKFLRYVEQAKKFNIPVASTTPADWLWGGKNTSSDLAGVISQGIIGDCSFLAALTNYARATKPDDLKKRIKLEFTIAGGPRVFSVQLYDKDGKSKWIRVDEPTAAQRLMYAAATDGSLWVSLFELAYLKLRIEEGRDPTKDLLLVNGSYFELAASGVVASAPIINLTGKAGTYKVVSTLSDAYLIKQFETIGTAPRVLSASTKSTLPERATKEFGLVAGHAYAVFSYDKVSKIITLRNPWNRPDLTGGKDVRVPLNEFKQWFEALATDIWL